MFDTIDHDILLHCLEHVFGIQGTGLSWFRCHLTKRFHIVSIQGTHSDQTELCCGVPQGSVLEPILFILYTLRSLVLFLSIQYLTCCMLIILKYTNHFNLIIVYLLFCVEKCVSDVKTWMMLITLVCLGLH